MRRGALSALGQRTNDPPISWLMKLALDRPQLISLAAGFTDDLTLPVAATRQIVSELLGHRSGRAALQYGSTVGDVGLRRAAAELVRGLDGTAGDDAAYALPRVLITSGSQQLLYLILEVLCDPGDLVLVEDPTYFVFLSLLQSRGLQARGIRMEHDGLDLSQLEQTLERLQRNGELPRLKALYLVSYFQNPTGRTTRFDKKAATLELLRHYERAAGHPLYLIEDSAYRELRFAGPDIPSGLAVSRAWDRVLYAGTFSKPFATGIRVGFGLLPEPVFSAVLRAKGNHDFGTSNFLQQIVARALVTGVYHDHVQVLQRRYATKARLMTKALSNSAAGTLEWDRPAGGLYVWARTTAGVRTGIRSACFHAALAKEVLYVPGEICYADDPTRPKPRNEMRLSFGNATAQEIATGVTRLGAVLGSKSTG